MEEVVVKLVLEGGSFYSELGKANRAFDDFEKDTNAAAKSAGGGFSAFEQVAIGALRHVGEIAIDVAGQAAGAIKGFVGDSISAAGDFEGGLNEFSAAAGSSLEAAGLDVQDFSDLFIQMGKELPVSTAEVEKAAIALVKGGLDPAIIAGGGLRDSLNFAAAGGMDLEAAAELGVKMLGTFTSVTDSAADKTAFLAQAQDLMVKAANASTLNVDALGDAMLQAGGQARAVGLDYQDFVTTMGLISPAFGSASEAGTSFKNFLVRLQPTTNPAKDAMRDLGLYTAETGSAFYDAQGKFIGVQAASQKLKDALSGLSDAQRVQALQAIFGNDAMGAAAALADGGSAAYEAFAQQMAGANGVAAQAEAVQQGLNFEMENFKGSVEAVQIAVGQLLSPALEGLYKNILTPLVGKVLEFVQAVGDSAAFAAFKTGLENGIVGGLTNMLYSLEEANPFWGSLADSILWVSDTAFPALVSFIKGTVIPAFGSLLSFLSPVIDFLKNAFAQAFGYLQSNALPAIQGLISNLTPLKDALFGAFQTALPIIQQVIGFIGDRLPGVLQAGFGLYQQYAGIVRGVFTEIIGIVTNVISAFANAFAGPEGAGALSSWEGAFESARTTIGNVMTAIQGVVMNVLGVVREFWAKNGDTIAANAVMIWGKVGDVVNQAMQFINTIIVPAITWIANFIRDNQSQIVSVFSATWSVVSTVIFTALNIIQSIMALIGNVLTGNWQGVANNIGDILYFLRKGVENAFWGILQFIGSLAGLFLTAALDLGANIIRGIINGIGAFASFLWDVVKGIASGIATTLQNALHIGSPSLLMAEQVGIPISQGIAQGIGMAANEPQMAASNLANSLIRPPAPAQAGGGYTTITNAPQWNYSPQYNSAPPSPSQDFAAMRLLSTAG